MQIIATMLLTIIQCSALYRLMNAVCNESPELRVARWMMDAARQLRSLAQDPAIARLVLVEEERFAKRVRQLEATAEQPELGLNGRAA
jgi:hypothetical protein